jgi:acetoacetyl-CoA synthetase
VVTEPMPSMPVGLWGDPDGSKLRSTYYARYPGCWHHGDWVTFFEDGSCVVSGRSDATLNRGGVRLGTADFYSVVEALPDVADSLVVHLEQADNPSGRLALFVVAPGATDAAALARAIAGELRSQLSPRHVPDVIELVPAIPRTLSGKKLEVPVKRVLLGAQPSDVASRDSMVDPNALDVFVEIRRRWTAEATG